MTGKEQVAEELSKLIKRSSQRGAFLNISKGIAKDVNEIKATFTLVRENEDDYPEVSLNAFYESGGYVLIVPEEGSVVVVGFADGSQDAFIAQASKIKKIKCKIGGFEISLDKDTLKSINTDSEFTQTKDSIKIKKATTEMTLSAQGINMKRNGEDLKSCVNDYMTEVDKILVVQGNNINKIATANIKNRINTILC
jgi:hypothetical protein